jgi:hypothetical protein
MPRLPDPGYLDELRATLPGEFPAMMERELPSLVDEIIDEIHATIPEYDRSLAGPYGQALRSGVERNVSGFVDWIATPAPCLDRRDDICRKLGQFEAYEGRRLDTLQSAYRVGALKGWRWLVTLHEQHRLPPETISVLAEALFVYMEELASLSLQGYQEAKAQSDEETGTRRRWLLHLIVERSTVPRDVLMEQAEPIGWVVPDTVTLVALPPGAPVVRSVLDGDLLVDLSETEPYLLIPGPLGDDRREMLHAALDETKAAVGLTVPLARASDSLRWARQALGLIHEGIIDDGPLTLCEDHLVTLWLLSDGPLIDQIARRRLSDTAGMTKGQRARFTETLRSWLRTRGSAPQISEDLGVHPQTVHYRMRKIETAVGAILADSDSRFATEAVLRAQWLRERASRSEPGT